MLSFIEQIQQNSREEVQASIKSAIGSLVHAPSVGSMMPHPKAENAYKKLDVPELITDRFDKVIEDIFELVGYDGNIAKLSLPMELIKVYKKTSSSVESMLTNETYNKVTSMLEAFADTMEGDVDMTLAVIRKSRLKYNDLFGFTSDFRVIINKLFSEISDHVIPVVKASYDTNHIDVDSTIINVDSEDVDVLVIEGKKSKKKTGSKSKPAEEEEDNMTQTLVDEQLAMMREEQKDLKKNPKAKRLVFGEEEYVDTKEQAKMRKILKRDNTKEQLAKILSGSGATVKKSWSKDRIITMLFMLERTEARA